MEWRPSEEENRYLRLVLSMTIDCMMGKGTDTVETYTNNLRIIGEELEVIGGIFHKEIENEMRDLR